MSIIELQFEDARNFSEGLAAVKINDKWGYIDRTGKLVINSQFNDASSFSEGLVAVKVDDKWGYINKMGNLFIDPQFFEANKFIKGLALVTTKLNSMLFEPTTGFIDKAGKLVFEKIGRLHEFSEGLTLLERRMFSLTYGSFINEKGEKAFDGSWSKVRDFSEGLAAVSNEYPEEYQSFQKIGWGYINKTGVLAINFQFNNASSFFEGLAAVNVDDKWGFIDKVGNLVINFQFDDVEDFSEGLAAVKAKNEWSCIDKTGEIIFKLPTKLQPYKREDWYVDIDGKFINSYIRLLGTNNKVGFVDTLGKILTLR